MDGWDWPGVSYNGPAGRQLDIDVLGVVVFVLYFSSIYENFARSF